MFFTMVFHPMDGRSFGWKCEVRQTSSIKLRFSWKRLRKTFYISTDSRFYKLSIRYCTVIELRSAFGNFDLFEPCPSTVMPSARDRNITASRTNTSACKKTTNGNKREC